MTYPLHAGAMLSLKESEMARRRLQKKGQLFIEGPWWRLRWREDAIAADGTRTRVRRNTIVGPSSWTEKQAEREAWEKILCHLDQCTKVPQSIMTLTQFIKDKFEPDFLWKKKHAGQLHYKYTLSKVVPVIGHIRLRDIGAEHIEMLCKGAIRLEDGETRGVQTAIHLRNTVHRVLEHARKLRHFIGENPASLVELPELVPQTPDALTFEQGAAALALLRSPIREAAFLSATTSANVAELCGLRWKRVNLSTEAVLSGDVRLPAGSLLIMENWYRGKAGTVKANRRKRIVPLPAEAIEMLAALRARDQFTSPDDYVFACRTGKPLDAHNVNNRQFKNVGVAVGAKITWHVWRHSCATFAEGVGMERSDRIALLGHGSGKMTDLYTHSDTERRRGGVQRIADRLLPKTAKKESGLIDMPVGGRPQ